MLKKFFPVIFVAVVLTIILTKPSIELDPEANAEDLPPKHPADHSMVQHLECAHGIVMGGGEDVDITLRLEGEYIRVTFQPDFLLRLREDALSSLEVAKPDTYMSEERFNMFLFMFHAYLTMAPVEPREGGRDSRPRASLIIWVLDCRSNGYNPRESVSEIRGSCKHTSDSPCSSYVSHSAPPRFGQTPDSFNCADFGAKGDARTDDTKANPESA